jgi:cGMP-dependent protein kinase
MSKTKIAQESLKDAVTNEKACMELLSSPFVVQLLATYRDASKVYLLIEPCFGGELFEVFSDNSDLFSSSVHAQFYAACTALGLEHMHSRRIVYRDLKLENCLLTTNGYLKLTDLGISKVCIGKTYTVCGTTDYFAPETLRQTGHNRAVDWWALGVMIYMMMTGRSPFEAPDTMKTYRKIISGFAKVQFPTDFPQQCSGMIKALCQKNPEERLTMGSLGIQNFKDHPWYRGFVWRSLETRTMTAPWTPNVDEAKIVAKIASKKPERVEEEEPVDELDGLTANWDDQFDMDLADSVKAGRKS